MVKQSVSCIVTNSTLAVQHFMSILHHQLTRILECGFRNVLPCSYSEPEEIVGNIWRRPVNAQGEEFEDVQLNGSMYPGNSC